MRKIWSVVFVLVVGLMLNGCGGQSKPVAVKESAPTATPTEAPKTVATTEKDAPAKTVGDDTLIVGFDESFPPYEWLENKESKGFNLDVVAAVVAKMGRQVEFRGLPWAQAMTDLKAGEIHLLSGAGITDERKKFMIYTDSFAASDYVIFSRNDNTAISGTTKDEVMKSLASKKVGVLAGGTVLEILRPYREIELVTGQNDLELFKKMGKNEIDAVFTDKLVGLYHIKNENLPYKVVGEPLKTLPMATAASKKDSNQALVDSYNKALAEVKADGTFDKIYEKWFGKK